MENAARGPDEFHLASDRIAAVLSDSIGVENEHRLGRQGNHVVCRTMFREDSQWQICRTLLQERVIAASKSGAGCPAFAKVSVRRG